ncbi:MAG: helix-turn-helix transcriptional regulator [Proteobacteria bacterium]|jgi:hypothetical protein|nr:helix-turn-helix transcriptional regulator [Pseudomonadota bacterium]
MSEPLLAWLRELLQKRNLNTSALSQSTQLPRQRIRRILSGSEDMTLDELLILSEALELSPGDFVNMPTFEEPAPSLQVVDEEPPLAIDPFGNHPEQLFRVGFDLGCDFLFLSKTSELEDSKIPGRILAPYLHDDSFPIRLDATFHKHMNPRFTPESLRINLSLDDGLYDCEIPWHAIFRVVFFPETPDEPEGPDTEEVPGTPHLRLVT